MIAIIEQTYEYKKRMQYQSDKKTFVESDYISIFYERGFPYPYGWLKESGTPPEPHWDVLIMTERSVELGDEISVKIVGVFMRNDGDHKFVAVEESREINDLYDLSPKEMKDLQQLYPRIGAGEGWFGQSIAMELYRNGDKSL